MSASFVITSSPVTALLDVKFEGLFETEDLRRLRARLFKAIAGLRCASGEHRALYDVSGCKVPPIQHQATVDELRRLSDRRGRVARRIAVVTGRSLMKMQLRRIVGGERSAGGTVLRGSIIRAPLAARPDDDLPISAVVAHCRIGLAGLLSPAAAPPGCRSAGLVHPGSEGSPPFSSSRLMTTRSSNAGCRLLALEDPVAINELAVGRCCIDRRWTSLSRVILDQRRTNAE